MIGLRLRSAWLSLALVTICLGQASAQVQATLSASFTPSTVAAGGTNTTLYEVTVTNPNGTALTGITFSVSFPSSITLGTFTIAGSACAGSGGSTSSGFNFSVGSLAAGASCNVSIHAQASTTTGSPFTVTTSTVTSNEVATAGPGASTTLTVAAPAATSFSVVAGTPITVFNQDSVTITCLDQNGNTFPSYSGTVNFTSTDPSFVSVSGQGVSLTNGTGTFNFVFRIAGIQTVTATDSVTSSITGTSNPITVNPGPTTRFIVSAASPQTAGTSFNFTVTAVDLNNNTTPAYGGTVSFSSTDPLAILPANSTLVNGTKTFTATLETAGNQTITATDAPNSLTGNSGTIVVNAVTSPTLTEGFGVGSIVVGGSTGVSFQISNPNSITGVQAIAFTDTLPAGLVVATPNGQSGSCLTSSGGVTAGTLTAIAGSSSISISSLGLAANTTCLFFVNVTGTSVGTKNNTTSPITSAQGGTGSNATASLTVTGAATHFSVSATSPHTAGVAFSITVTALDAGNNTVASYAGTVHFTSTDGAATLAADSTLTNGVGVFSVTLKTAGNQTITATDTVTPSVTGTSSGITVTPGPATHLSVSAPASATQNTSFSLTVTGLDQFNNTATGYAGPVHFTSSDALATLPADATLTNGVGAFSATLNTAGNQTISALDTVNSSITGTSGNISVAGPTTLVVTTLADSGAGSLRAAITNANASSGNVTITFAVTGTINFASALPPLTQSMTITGPGAASLTIDGLGDAQLFNVNSGITVSISGVTIQGGLGDGSGGGGVTNLGALTLSSCVVTGNEAISGVGGAIYNSGTLTINQCSITSNGTNNDLGFGRGGGLFNSGTATITNSTFSGNTTHGGNMTGGQGGAIYNGVSSSLTVTDSTIDQNTATDESGGGSAGGGAIYNLGTATIRNGTITRNRQIGTLASDFGGGIVVGSGGSSTLANTILGENADSGPSPNPDGSGTFVDGGNNLIGISTGVAGIANGVNGDQVGTSGSPLSPHLGGLLNNGGPTSTRLPGGNSPALGAGNPAGFLSTDTDQRGSGFLRLRNGVTDIGAVQLQGVALAATAGTPQSAGVGATFGTSLAATATESCGACASVVPGVTVTFTPPGSGPSGTFAGGVNTEVTNSSGVATAGAFTANMIAGGPYNVTASATTPDQADPASANFSLTNTGSVSKPVLTVTANNASKVTGAPLPTFTATITGFVNGDTLAVVSGAPSLTTTATASSPAGSYPIIAGLGTLSALHYTFAFVNGTLTVTAPPPPPAQPASINVVSGSGQSGAVGSPFAAPLVAVVMDQNGNVMSGVVVSFGVFSGSATLSATEVTTGLNGTAEITATPTATGAIEILASVNGVSKVATFLETGSGTTAPAQLSVLPAALALTAVEGGGNPLPASIAISNTGTGTLAWSASESATPAWLTVSAASGATPAAVTANVNAAGLKAGSYPGTIKVTSGSQQKTVAVTLTVVPSAPQEFALTPAAVVVNAAAGSTAPISRVIDIANGGTGTLSWSAAVNAGNAWLSVSPASGSSASGTVPSTLTVQLNPSGLAAGQYLGNITLSGSGVAPANVAVVVNISALPDLISAVPLLEFRGPVGSSFAPQAIPVTTTTGAAVSLNASASVTAGMSWLSISGAGGSTPGSISVSVNTSGLAAGYYVGFILVQSSGAGNTLLVPVVLDLSSASAPGTLSATPGGVLFAGSTNSTGALSQSIAVSSDAGSFSWNAVALAGSSGTWLTISPASGSGNGTFTVTANPAGLQPGSYSGQVAISATGTSNAGLIIPVTLVVSSATTPGTSTSMLQPIQPAGDFIANVGVPVALQGSIFSSTGTPVTGATVQVAFTTGDSPVILTDVGGGNYVGVWTPLHAGPASLLFTSPGLSTGVVTGAVTSTGMPAFSGAGVVNAAPMVSAAPLGVGSIATIFGLNLASHPASAKAFPLPLTLGGVAVTINGVQAPLFYASSTQINFFVPYELAGETSATILVSTPAGVAAVTGVPITPESPGVFLTDAAGDAAVTHLNGQPVNAAAPAAAGEIVQIFATGLGLVSNAPNDDAAAPTNPLAMDQITPVVTIGGVNAKVLFAGLAPTFSGLNQIDVVVPAGLPSGPATLTVTVGPLASNTALVQLQ